MAQPGDASASRVGRLRDRLLLAAYGAWVLGLTTTHDLRILAAALLVLVAISGRRAPQIAGKALRAFIWFNLVVTVSYLVLSLWREGPVWSYVALVNLRVAVLVWSGFWIAVNVDLFRALSFSRTLTHLLTIAYGQILALRRILTDFREALRSRTMGRLRLRDLYRQRAAAAAFLLGRGLQDATEITLAMRSRGFFDDHS